MPAITLPDSVQMAVRYCSRSRQSVVIELPPQYHTISIRFDPYIDPNTYRLAFPWTYVRLNRYDWATPDRGRAYWLVHSWRWAPRSATQHRGVKFWLPPLPNQVRGTLCGGFAYRGQPPDDWGTQLAMTVTDLFGSNFNRDYLMYVDTTSIELIDPRARRFNPYHTSRDRAGYLRFLQRWERLSLKTLMDKRRWERLTHPPRYQLLGSGCAELTPVKWTRNQHGWYHTEPHQEVAA